MRHTLTGLIVFALLAMPASLLAGKDCGSCEKKEFTSAESAAKTECTTAKAECSSLKTALFKVGGADCEASCDTLSKALTAVNGVADNAVCSVSKTAKVSFDPTKTNRKQILAAMKKAGYTVKGEQVEFKVNGLACGACVSKVDKALTSLKGVSEKSVCHESKKAVVTFDPEKLTGEQVAATIAAAGFKVEAN